MNPRYEQILKQMAVLAEPKSVIARGHRPAMNKNHLDDWQDWFPCPRPNTRMRSCRPTA
jgi:hypothetical protein